MKKIGVYPGTFDPITMVIWILLKEEVHYLINYIF